MLLLKTGSYGKLGMISEESWISKRPTGGRKKCWTSWKTRWLEKWKHFRKEMKRWGLPRNRPRGKRKMTTLTHSLMLFLKSPMKPSSSNRNQTRRRLILETGMNGCSSLSRSCLFKGRSKALQNKTLINKNKRVMKTQQAPTRNWTKLKSQTTCRIRDNGQLTLWPVTNPT